MILESILEKSGLKGREYFLEHQLTDENNKVIFSEFSGKKMRPDAVIKYPDRKKCDYRFQSFAYRFHRIGR